MRNTAINRILKPSLSFIGESDGGLTPVADREVSKEFRHVASSEYLMNSCKMSSTLFMAEIRRKNTTFDTFSPQEFASTTRGARSCHVTINSFLFRAFRVEFLKVLFMFGIL